MKNMTRYESYKVVKNITEIGSLIKTQDFKIKFKKLFSV